MVYLFCTRSLSCSTHQCVSAGVNRRKREVEYWSRGLTTQVTKLRSRLKRKSNATHSAAVLQHGEGEAAVALSSQLHIVGALEYHGLLQAAALTVHVGNAVLAVVGDVLAGLVGQQAHEGQLGGHALGAEGLIVVGELQEGKNQ